MPFITEELWNQIDKERDYIMISEYPLPENFNEVLNNDFKKVFEMVTGLRLSLIHI